MSVGGMTRESFLRGWESGKSVENIIDDFGTFRERLVDRITELVKDYNGEIVLSGYPYHYVEEDECVHSTKYKKLTYSDGNCIVHYDWSDGWEMGYDTESVEEDLWVFSMNEIFDILTEIRNFVRYSK